MSTFKDEQIELAIEHRATEWFVMHRERPLEPGERREYLQWLQASPRHVRAYLNVVEMAGKLSGALREVGAEGQSAVDPAPRESGIDVSDDHFLQYGAPNSERPRLRRGWVAAAAAIALVALGVAYWSVKSVGPKPLYVPAEKQRMLTLEDGSILHLNSDTRVVLRYSPMQRLIELKEGQGLFDVKHDARRPFIVRAGALDVVALGTEFQVRRLGERTDVTVLEGRVEVMGERTDASTPARTVRLGPGQQATYTSLRLSSQRTLQDAASETAWAREEIKFASARLRDVAAQFNRHTGASIEIEDESLRDYRVSGVFQAYDLDSFLAYLGQFDGVVIERDGDEVLVRRKNR